MKLFMTAVYKNKSGVILGFNILNVDTNTTVYIEYRNLLYSIIRGEIIDNLGIEKNIIVGTNGSIERYAELNGSGEPIRKPIVILNSITNNNKETIGFRVATWNGDILKLKVNDAIKYAKLSGIANGMIKEINGKTVISSIRGSYENEIMYEGNNNYKVSNTNTIDMKPWTVEEFENYMQANRYSYNIKIYDSGSVVVKNVDSRVKILKLPIGTDGIGEGLIKNNDKIDCLIIPPTKMFNIYNDIKVDKLIFLNGTYQIECKNDAKICDVSQIIFPESLIALKNFCNNCNIAKIDMRNTKVIEIAYSFVNCKNLKEILLPDTLKKLYNSIISTGIESLKLPDGLKVIGDNSISMNSELREISTPKDLVEIRSKAISENDITNYVVYDTVNVNSSALDKKINLLVIETTSSKKGSLNGSMSGLEFSEGTKIIKSRDIYGVYIKNVKFPVSTEVIEDGLFSNGGIINNINFKDLINLKSIGKDCFKSTLIETLEFNEGLEKIGENSFYINSFRKVILPKSLEKPTKNTFGIMKNSSKCSSIMFYVHKGSKAEKYCTGRMLRYNIIEDSNNDNTEITDAQIAKIKMLLGNKEEHKALLSDRYIKDSKKLLQLWNLSNTKILDYNTEEAELNKSKLINVPIKAISLVEEIINSLDNKDLHINKMTNRFIHIMNLLTDITELNINPFTTKGMQWIKNIMDSKCNTVYTIENSCFDEYVEVNYIYNDGYSRIINISMVIKNRSFNIIAATVGDNIIYSTVIKNININNDLSYTNDDYVGAMDSIKKGDVIKETNIGSIINEINIPNYIYKRLVEQLKMVVINIYEEGEGDIKVGIKYNIETGKYYTCKMNESRYNNEYIIISIEDSIKNINKKYISGIKKAADTEYMMQYFRGIANKEKYINELKNRDDAYDKDSACFEWKLGQVLNELNINEVIDLDENMVYAILNSGFFVKKPIQKRKMDYGVSKYKIKENIILRMYQCYEDETIYVIQRDGSLEKYMYVGKEKINDIIKMLKKLNPTHLYYNMVTNDLVDRTNFVMLNSLEYGSKYKYSVAIDKTSGSVCLIGYDDYYTSACKIILIFKDLGCSVELINEIEYSSKKELEEAVMNLIKDNYDNSSEVIKLMEMIMNGLPNNAITDNKYDSWLKYIAKQRAI